MLTFGVPPCDADPVHVSCRCMLRLREYGAYVQRMSLADPHPSFALHRPRWSLSSYFGRRLLQDLRAAASRVIVPHDRANENEPEGHQRANLATKSTANEMQVKPGIVLSKPFNQPYRDSQHGSVYPAIARIHCIAATPKLHEGCSRSSSVPARLQYHDAWP